MKILILILFSFFFTAPGFCQNLVPNPSFENYTECPDSVCELPTGWYSFSYTPDYYNSCASIASNYSVPYNTKGYQPAYEGNGYIGVFCYGMLSSAKEYVAAELSQPLSIGQTYYVQFHAVLSDKIGTTCAIKNLGALFTTTSFAQPVCTLTPSLLPPNYAHITSANYVTDTANWTAVTGSFVADSAYNYIALGNFFDDANTDTITLNGLFCDAYYLIDDVYVSTSPPVSITEAPNQNIVTFYPNPARDYLHIEDENLKPVHIAIYNINGNLLINEAIAGNYNRIDLRNLPAGFYFISMKQQDFITTKKLIIH